MAKMIPENKKFVWLIKNFSSLPSGKFYSAPVLISDVKWRFLIYPKGCNGSAGNNYLNVFLCFADGQSLPSGWGRYLKLRLTVVNQISYELSIHREEEMWFEEKHAGSGWGPTGFLPITKLIAKDSGFLVGDELRISAEIQTLDVIGMLDESKEASEPLKEITDVNGFQVVPSQVESVRRIFELHPHIAANFRGKNQHVRTACMNVLLSFMELLRQPVKELSTEDLEEADVMLDYLKNAYLNVDWLEMELDQVKEKMETEKAQAQAQAQA